MVKSSQKIYDLVGSLADKLFGKLLGDRLAKNIAESSPNVFENIGYHILRGVANSENYPLEHIHQYEPFRELWESKFNEKLPDYKVAKYGGLFASSNN